MKVKELIEILSQQDPETVICLKNTDPTDYTVKLELQEEDIDLDDDLCCDNFDEDDDDIFDDEANLTTTCTREELNDVLTELELMEPNDHYSNYAWVIFENGIMIQG